MRQNAPASPDARTTEASAAAETQRARTPGDLQAGDLCGWRAPCDVPRVSDRDGLLVVRMRFHPLARARVAEIAGASHRLHRLLLVARHAVRTVFVHDANERAGARDAPLLAGEAPVRERAVRIARRSCVLGGEQIEVQAAVDVARSAGLPSRATGRAGDRAGRPRRVRPCSRGWRSRGPHRGGRPSGTTTPRPRRRAGLRRHRPSRRPGCCTRASRPGRIPARRPWMSSRDRAEMPHGRSKRGRQPGSRPRTARRGTCAGPRAAPRAPGRRARRSRGSPRRASAPRPRTPWPRRRRSHA